MVTWPRSLIKGASPIFNLDVASTKASPLMKARKGMILVKSWESATGTLSLAFHTLRKTRFVPPKAVWSLLGRGTCLYREPGPE